MSDPLRFSSVPDLREYPRRRIACQDELTHAIRILSDERARDRAHLADTLAALRTEITDLRWRLAELERAAELADVGRAPISGPALRRFA